MTTINGDLKVSGTNKTLKDLASSGGDFLPLTGGTITGDLRLKGGSNYGRKINLGDGDYVYISEPEDDVLELKAKSINFSIRDEKISFTPNNCSNYNNYGNCYYYRVGSRVCVHVGVSGLTSAKFTQIYTLPSGYRPLSQYKAIGGGSKADDFSTLQVNTNGEVYVVSQGQHAIIDGMFDVFDN